METQTLITVQQVDSPRETIFVAHGPDGHSWLLKRLTRVAAEKDGLAYFLATRVLRDGRWVLS
jgi:hypothetical protein